MKLNYLFKILLGLVLIVGVYCCKKNESGNVPQTLFVEDAPLVDCEGNTYKTVKIGNQVWMAENLRVTKYRNGDAIPEITINALWASSSTGAYCWYANDAANKTIYGALYNWYTVTDSRKIAPDGWHIPTESDWTTLISYLGGDNVSGGKLKGIGTTYWKNPNTGADNKSGLTVLPTGNRDGNGGEFRNLSNDAYIWMDSNSTKVWFRYLTYNDAKCVAYSDDYKQNGFAIRCIKD